MAVARAPVRESGRPRREIGAAASHASHRRAQLGVRRFSASRVFWHAPQGLTPTAVVLAAMASPMPGPGHSAGTSSPPCTWKHLRRRFPCQW